MFRALSLLCLATPLALPAQQRLLLPEDRGARQTAVAVLGMGVDSVRSWSPDIAEERLGLCLATARECLPESMARTRVEALLAHRGSLAASAAAVAELVDDLVFTPVAEADLPRGVPGFQAVDELELRHYPAYRMVRTDMKAGSMGAFWPLFQHIQANEIAMTTPVQVDYRRDGERMREASMAFLYGSPDLGNAGKDGRVEVVDVPPTAVLSIGARGYDRPARIAELRTRIEAWLAAQADWQAAGELRVMGYNSPSVLGERRYFEVQIPVQRRAADGRQRESV